MDGGTVAVDLGDHGVELVGLAGHAQISCNRERRRRQSGLMEVWLEGGQPGAAGGHVHLGTVEIRRGADQTRDLDVDVTRRGRDGVEAIPRADHPQPAVDAERYRWENL